MAEVAREHGWHPPKSLDSDENFKPEHTLFCRELRFVAIYALFFLRSLGKKSAFLGPRGPLVLPSVGSFVRPARKIWITYLQAFMPYES